MQTQRRRDTAPEVAIRKALHALGWRFRIDYKVPSSRRRMDIAFPRLRVAVFVDGCFWHACPIHGSAPRQNADWWAEKLRKNVERDRDTDRLLAQLGWTVVRVWEHEDVAKSVRRLQSLLERRVRAER
jgi:DNA mismatch endonuclease (patch repair protein)